MNIVIVSGDDYSNSDNRAFVYNVTGAPSLAAGSVALTAYNGTTEIITKAGTISTSGSGVQVIYFEFTAAQTLALDAGVYTYKVVATLANGRQLSIVKSGQFTVVERAGL